MNPRIERAFNALVAARKAWIQLTRRENASPHDLSEAYAFWARRRLALHNTIDEEAANVE